MTSPNSNILYDLIGRESSQSPFSSFVFLGGFFMNQDMNEAMDRAIRESMNSNIEKDDNVTLDIPSINYTEKYKDSACCICTDEFSEEKKRIVVLEDCNHVFHHDCIQESVKYQSICPVCREKIPVTKVKGCNKEVNPDESKESTFQEPIWREFTLFDHLASRNNSSRRGRERGSSRERRERERRERERRERERRERWNEYERDITRPQVLIGQRRRGLSSVIRDIETVSSHLFYSN